MLITPIISSGIPEIPVIDGKCLGPIVIPFIHHPSKTSASSMYVRIVDEYEYIDSETNEKIQKKDIEEFELQSITNPLVFKIQKSSDNKIYKFDKRSNGTIIKTEVIQSHEADKLNMSLSHLINYNLKFQLSYDGNNWSPAVTAKCIPNIFTSDNEQIDKNYFNMEYMPMGLKFTYDIVNTQTELQSLQIQTYCNPGSKQIIEKNKILNIVSQNNIIEGIKVQQQTASCILNNIPDSNDDLWCSVFATTTGGYNFSYDVSLLGWKRLDIKPSINIRGHGVEIKTDSMTIDNAVLCRKKSLANFWEPLSYQVLPCVYIDSNAIAGQQYLYAYFNFPGSLTVTEAPALARLMTDTEYVAFNTNDSDDEAITAPFQETMYLKDIISDEIEELKTLYIEYNPQISSFKRVIQEQKIETIGNQYPIFVRNGHINYHEFTIGGLISYWIDPYIPKDAPPTRTGFYTTDEWTIINMNNQNKAAEDEKTPSYTNTIQLTPENILREAQFRTDVFNWLINGKNKEFYSPTEGRMIVRLSNVQLTPETKLGRMIYSFTAQATEVNKIPSEEEGEIIT